jgi:hypothetical protein
MVSFMFNRVLRLPFKGLYFFSERGTPNLYHPYLVHMAGKFLLAAQNGHQS